MHRVLVLTSSTGSGHDMRAKAFAKWVRKVHGKAVEVRIEQVLENGSSLGRFGVWIYNTIHRHAPFLHNVFFFIVEVFIFSHSQKVSFGGRYYRRLVADYQPDLILSVHDSTNRGFFEDARRVLDKPVRCVTYCGEYSGGYGYSRNWVNPGADHFIARTEEARQFAVKLGIRARHSSVFQRVLPPEALENRLTPAQCDSLLQQLGLRPGRFTLFLATGGFGANHHRTFLKTLLPLAADLQVIVVCGRNQSVFEALSRWKEAHLQLALHLEGYSSTVSEFLQVAHAVVTRGGANTATEALHFRCPMLYNSLGGLMPQERCTTRFFLKNEAAALIRQPLDLPRILRQWIHFGPEYERVCRNLEALRRDESPEDFVHEVFGEIHPA